MRAAGLALQAQSQLHVFQEREETKALLAVDDHAVPIGEQSVAGRPGATVQLLTGAEVTRGRRGGGDTVY